MWFQRFRVLFVAGLLASVTNGQDRPIAFVGAHLIPIRGVETANGTVIVHDGKIVDVGPSATVTIPRDVTQVDASGKVIMPGLVCTHNHVGGIGGADSSNPIQPGIRIYDSINVMNSGFRRVVAGGLTTINIMPGSGHLLSGQTVYVKLRGGNTVEQLFIRDADGKPMGGMKMANGTNSIRKKPFPGTRGKSAALVRAQYVKAQEYR